MKIAAHSQILMASALGFSLTLLPPIGATAHAQEAGASTATVQAAADAAREMEFTAWRNASKAGRSGDYQAYLKAYPAGKFAKVAKSRLEILMAKATTETPAAQTAAGPPPAATEQVEPQAEPGQGTASEQATEPAGQAATDELSPVPNPGEGPASRRHPDQTLTAEPNQTTEPANEWEQEYALWKAAAQGNTIGEYEAYLASFPTGKFAAIAQSRIAMLTAAEKPVSGVAEGDEEAATQENNATPAEPPADDQAESRTLPGDAQEQAADQGTGEDRVPQEHFQQSASDDRQPPLMIGTPVTEDSALNFDGRAEIQGRLSSMGFDTAGADGAFGPRSRSAIADWQEANQAPVSGYLGIDQVDLIRQQSNHSYAEWLNAGASVRQPIIVRRPVIVRERIFVHPRVVIRHPLAVRRPVVVLRRQVVVVPNKCIGRNGRLKKRCR